MECKIIEKKILPKYFEEIKSGKKMFEVRMNDENYQVGDILILKEGNPQQVLDDPDHHIFIFTGNQIKCKITYILTGKEINEIFKNSTSDDLVVMGIEVME